MGGHSYNSTQATFRASSVYQGKSTQELFQQARKRRVHESMDPKAIRLRECRDSDVHPMTFPMIFTLDVTGSMGRIPEMLIRSELPTLVNTVIGSGVHSPQILFMGIGDQYSDDAPLQIGQFEGGDEQMEMWLKNTWLEGNGGSNARESYLLAWYFAANHTVTDAFEKRGKKGLLITVGDEASHRSIDSSVMNKIMDISVEGTLTDIALLTQAQEKWECYHLHVMEGNWGPRTLGYWKDLMGENCIEVSSYKNIPKIVADLAIRHGQGATQTQTQQSPSIML